MKTLQSNYTPPEQSKRLLELGVPANSADCYYTAYGIISVIMPNINDTSFICEVGCTPCWSVGKLIEVFEICTRSKFKRVRQTDDLIFLSPLEDVLLQIEHNACGFFDNTKWEINLLNK